MTGVIIALFLGVFGGYRFYKKQYGLFILYLLTGGIFGIGWIIDIICSIADINKNSKNKEISNPISSAKDNLPSYMKLEKSSYMEPAFKYTRFIAKQKNYVVFDFETTGVEPEYCEIIEIGALKVENGEIVDRFQSFVKPCFPIPADATEINNITNEMVMDAPTADEIIPLFIEFIGNNKLVGYNIAKFDYIILRRYALDICGILIENSISDVYKLSRKFLSLKRYRLSDVAKHFKIDTSNAHRAIGDCETTFECFKKLQDILKKESEERKKLQNED